MPNKLCYKCGRELPLEQFNKNCTRKDGLSAECKDCCGKYIRDYYQKHREYYLDKVNARVKSRQEYINQFKTKCSQCGMEHPAALDFHHIDQSTKRFALSAASKMKLSLEEIKDEIDKCVILCANCHRIEHFDKYDNTPTVKREPKPKPPKQPRPVVAKQCIKCGAEFTTDIPEKIYCSTKCRRRTKYKHVESTTKRPKPPTKEELKELLWKIPTTHIAKKYGVSDTAVKKWARKYKLDKPPRGYWTKVEWGKV